MCHQPGLGHVRATVLPIQPTHLFSSSENEVLGINVRTDHYPDLVPYKDLEAYPWIQAFDIINRSGSRNMIFIHF